MTDELPKTQQEAETTMFQMILCKAYRDLAEAATQRRLTEHDISVIQRNAIAEIQQLTAAADEFPGFELEPSIANVKAALRVLFDNFSGLRIGKHPR